MERVCGSVGIKYFSLRDTTQDVSQYWPLVSTRPEGDNSEFHSLALNHICENN